MPGTCALTGIMYSDAISRGLHGCSAAHLNTVLGPSSSRMSHTRSRWSAPRAPVLNQPSQAQR